MGSRRILHVALTFASNIKCALRIYRINFEQVAKRGRGKSQKLQVARRGARWGELTNRTLAQNSQDTHNFLCWFVAHTPKSPKDQGKKKLEPEPRNAAARTH